MRAQTRPRIEEAEQPQTGAGAGGGAYAKARAAFEAGETAAAAALYLECLTLDPGHAEACHDLGVIMAQAGRTADALHLLSRAAALRPGLAEAQDDLGVLLARAGRAQEAIAAGRAAVAARPDCASFSINLGDALEGAGDLIGAAEAFRSAVAAEPTSAIGLLKLSNVLRRLGEFDAALACAERAATVAPDHHGARIISAMILDGLGRFEEAEDDVAAAVRLCPPSAEALNHLGVICLDQGRLEVAVEVLQRAVALDPGSADARAGLALALHKQGRLMEAFAVYVEAVTIAPGHVTAQCNLGGLLLTLGHVEAAVSACRLAIHFGPAQVEAHLYLGMALNRQGKTAEALAAFRQALTINPASGAALVEICEIRQQSADWPGLDAERRAALASGRLDGTRVPPFQVLTLTDSPAEQQAAARLWAAGFRHRAPPLAPYAPRAPGARHRKLRIGYLSADFRTHATAMLVAGLFERHDRARFDIVGYSYGEDDHSALRRRLVGALDRFTDIRALPHREAARRIHADGIDILIDLKGYTLEARTEILAHRPAPIQVNFLGYPGTMGAGFIDYMIADRVVAPLGDAALFDETLVHLPHSYQPNDSARAVAAYRPTRGECGLPAQGFVFCCLNNSYKITAEMFDIWMRLLRREPGSVLWLFEGDGSASPNLRREALARGVDPERLVFAPRILPEQHLARLGLADLFLDTLPVNAHTTASEALWMGLPVITCRGRAFAARVGASLLTAVGLPELVTESLADYEALASSLACDPERLGRIRARLALEGATSPLFDTARYTRHFEAALSRMAELRDLGLPPEAFAIEDL